MITTELVDNLFITSIALIPIFASVGLPFVINNEKVSDWCLGGMLLSLISSMVLMIFMVWL